MRERGGSIGCVQRVGCTGAGRKAQGAGACAQQGGREFRLMGFLKGLF